MLMLASLYSHWSTLCALIFTFYPRALNSGMWIAMAINILYMIICGLRIHGHGQARLRIFIYS